MNSTELSCREFTARLASAAPAPGGGGAAAFLGALGTALTNMVGSLTVGKPKYVDIEAELITLMVLADAMQNRLLKLAEKDEEVFVPLSKAYGLPKTTEKEAQYKAEVMASCLIDCVQVPLEIMHTCGEALEITERFEQVGTEIAMSDVGCGAVTLKAALLSADLNVRINTKLMKDRSRADAFNSQAEALLEKYIPMADSIYQKVQARYI